MERGSSSSTRLPRLNKVIFQMLVSLDRRDPSLKDGIQLPAYFKNQLTKECPYITLVDDMKREFAVEVSDQSDGVVLLSNDGWKNFMNVNLFGDYQIVNLCFRLVKENVFEVYCFNEEGVEWSVNHQSRLYMKRVLVNATRLTVSEQYLPSNFLQDLNYTSITLPCHPRKATLAGPRLSASVNVIYRLVNPDEEVKKWRAVGFQADDWTNFVNFHHIGQNTKIIFSTVGNGFYTVDVFNPYGVGLGGNGLRVQNFDESEEVAVEQLHECRIFNHKHRLRNPSIIVILPDHLFRSKGLTIPSDFVRLTEMYTFEDAIIVFGILGYNGKVNVVQDRRRPGDLSHVVLQADWRDILDVTGMQLGDVVRLEFKVQSSADKGVVVLNIC